MAGIMVSECERLKIFERQLENRSLQESSKEE